LVAVVEQVFLKQLQVQMDQVVAEPITQIQVQEHLVKVLMGAQVRQVGLWAEVAGAQGLLGLLPLLVWRVLVAQV
jgi:hypothetical protein